MKVHEIGRSNCSFCWDIAPCFSFLFFSKVLKSIDLRWNLLGGREGEKVIRDAVGGRVGFELKM